MGINVMVNDDGCEVDDLAFCGAVLVTVAAGESWDEFVELAVRSEWVGVETLSGLGSTVGEIARHNLGAYGQAPGDTIASIRTWDRAADAQRTFAAADCGFGEHGSRLTERFDLLDVSFLFRQGDLTRPICDPGLADLLDIPLGQRVPLTQVCTAVRAARAEDGCS